MKVIFQTSLFLIFILLQSCTPKISPVESALNTPEAQVIPTTQLEDGFYIISKTGNDRASLKPLTATQKIITYNKDFYEPEDDKYLVIETADFVPLDLKEKPTTGTQEDKTKNFYLVLNDLAKTKLEQFTTLNLYKTTGIIVNGEAYTKHQIKGIIDGGRLQITQCTENTCRLLYDQFDDNIVGLPSDKDWGNLQRFKKQNKEAGMPKANENRIVFMGNSITEGWLQDGLSYFDNPSFINRGISGQTTPQMLLRFRQDVIDLNPKAVVILAGINDIAGNTGPMTIEAIFKNIQSMSELAKINDIEVILCSVLPAYDFPWNPGLNPADKVIELNRLIKKYCDRENFTYVDYFSKMTDERKGLPKDLSEDEVHPTLKGYKIMEEVLDEVLMNLKLK